MIAGLSDTEQAFLGREVFTPLHRAGRRCWIFGSRARGDHQPFSDVDLLIDGPEASRALLGSLEERLVESNFPYKVDLVHLPDLAESYRERVLRERRAAVEPAHARG